MPAGRLAFALATAAVGWAALFTWWALTASVYSDGQTILDANPEPIVRVAIALPLGISAAVWLSLRAACRHDSVFAHRLGVGLASVLLVLAVLTGFSIGMAVLPGAVALMSAAAITPLTDTRG